MCKKPLQQLSDLDFEQKKLNFPNMPESAIPRKKFSDKNANELTKSCIALIQLNGYQAERISVTGQVRDNRKKYVNVLGQTRIAGSIDFVKSNMTAGSADISATIKGRSVKIEIKYGRDKQSEAQKSYQADIERAGGTYIIVKTYDEFYKWFNEFITL